MLDRDLLEESLSLTQDLLPYFNCRLEFPAASNFKMLVCQAQHRNGKLANLATSGSDTSMFSSSTSSSSRKAPASTDDALRELQLLKHHITSNLMMFDWLMALMTSTSGRDFLRVVSSVTTAA